MSDAQKGSSAHPQMQAHLQNCPQSPRGSGGEGLTLPTWLTPPPSTPSLDGALGSGVPPGRVTLSLTVSTTALPGHPMLFLLQTPGGHGDRRGDGVSGFGQRSWHLLFA